jgi:hypothetical protein
MLFQHAAAGARLVITGKLDVGEETSFPVAVRGGRSFRLNSGRASNSSLPPDNVPRTGVAWDMRKASVALVWLSLDTTSIEAVRVFTKHPQPGHPLPRERRVVEQRG